MNRELSANTILSHYRVVSKLGAGGMGEVFLAQDIKLHCKVKLKILTRTRRKIAWPGPKLGRGNINRCRAAAVRTS